MFGASALTPWNLLTATAALLAFLIGLMGLVGRERKSPYVVNTIIAIFIACLVGAAIDLLSFIVPCGLSEVTLKFGLVILLFAFGLSIYRTYKIFTRLHYFVDHLSVKNLPLVKHVRRWINSRRQKPSYEFNPLKFPQPVEEGFDKFAVDQVAETRVASSARSICVRTKYIRQIEPRLLEISLLCLEYGVTVQYITASRHPIEFVSALKRLFDDSEKDFQSVSNKLVVIDAFSPHYAFLDSIYAKRTIDIGAFGVPIVTAKMSYAGVHTATSRAFNLLKKNVKKDNRLPTLVVYEDMYAISDLESVEQYRIFVRHVLPSERLFGGMLTLFTESAQPDEDWEVLQAQADIVIDMTTGAPNQP